MASDTLTCTAPDGDVLCGMPAVEILLTRPSPEMVRNAIINGHPRCAEHPAVKEVAGMTHYDPDMQWIVLSLLAGSAPFAVGFTYTAMPAS